MTTVTKSELSELRYKDPKAYYQEVLKDVKVIYVAGVKKSTNRYWDAGHWNTFNVYFINSDSELELIWFAGSHMSAKDMSEVPHWKKTSKENRSYHFTNRVLGMDRIFDIVYSLGMYLFNDGYKFKEEFLSS